MEKTLFEKMGGTYHQEGEYLLPDLTIPESTPIGIWGQRRKQYLKVHQNPLYTALLLGGKLDDHLAEVDTQAETMFLQLVEQMAKQEGIAEMLKAEDQLEWVRRMNNIRNRAEEIIHRTLIFV